MPNAPASFMARRDSNERTTTEAPTTTQATADRTGEWVATSPYEDDKSLSNSLKEFNRLTSERNNFQQYTQICRSYRELATVRSVFASGDNHEERPHETTTPTVQPQQEPQKNESKVCSIL